MQTQNLIPTEVVLELLGNVSFSKKQENDVQIAENIAGNSYTSMSSLCDTIEGCINIPRELKDFRLLRKRIEAGEEPYFKPYIDSVVK